MPYSKVSEAPANIRKLNGSPLALSQVNWIAKVADGIPEGQVDNPWAVAIAQFKRAYTVKDGKWVKKTEEEKELSYIINRLGLGAFTASTDEAFAVIEKNDHGTYNIMTVSTAAVKDREDETFTVEAIDYDLKEAERLNDYPEYRVFHSKHLGFGKVHKMMRVGIFAVDVGESYDDPFSISICEKMLTNNDGRWRVSRGFRVHELSGSCPECDDKLLISTKHMLAGFRCPSCETVHLRFKGVLDGIQFKKARTFDVTVTDVPAVPMTGAMAWRAEDDGGIYMTKKELKERLLEAGIPEDAVDARLKDVTSKQLKEISEIPEAELLKEFEGDTGSEEDDAVVMDYDSFENIIRNVVRKEVETALNGFQIEVDGFEVENKEASEVIELKEIVAELSDKIDELLESDEDRLKELLESTSRSGRIKIARMKSSNGKKKFPSDEDDDEEDEDEEEKELAPWIKSMQKSSKSEGSGIVDSAGAEYPSMTALVHGHPNED